VHRYVARTARVAGIGRPIGPHALRRTVGTVGLNQGIPLRDIQHLLRHTRPETTLASYDISGDALERHASHQVAGFLAGWADCPTDGTPSPAPRCTQGGLWDIRGRCAHARSGRGCPRCGLTDDLSAPYWSLSAWSRIWSGARRRETSGSPPARDRIGAGSAVALNGPFRDTPNDGQGGAIKRVRRYGADGADARLRELYTARPAPEGWPN
jgi:hypothetical protein